MATANEQADIAADYGWALAILRSNPELSALFDRAITGKYNPARFVAELRNTKWYRQHSEAYRQSEVLKKADPAEWNRRRAQARANIQEQYYQLTGRKLQGKQLWQMADQSLMAGFNDNEIRDMLGHSFRTENLMRYGNLGGQLGDAERQLRQAMEDYGLPFSDTAIARQLNAIATQGQDVTSTIAYYRKAAMQKYAAFADELRAGMTIRDIAEPFKQQMARTLEISDKSISTSDALIQRALTYREPAKGGKPGKPTGMPLWQFEQRLKADPRWLKTQNAQNDIMQTGRQVLTDMGLIA